MRVDLSRAAIDERDWETGDVDEPVRFAVVGLGGFACDRALPAVAETDYCEVGAVVSGSAEKADRIADEYDAEPLTYDAYDAGDRADAYDAVYVVTPNALHLPYVETAAGLGKHVLVEKPMEATLDRAERLRDVCTDAGVRLMVAYRMQAEPVVRRMREWIGGGAIGDPVQFHGTLRFQIGDPDQWRLDPDLAGGGALMDIGVYPLNTGRFLLDAEPTGVSGSTASVDDAFAGVDEHVDFRLEFPGGVTGDCQASFDSQFTSGLEVVGTEGVLRLEPAFTALSERTLTLERDGLRTEVAGLDANEVVEEFDYFAHAIRTDAPIEPDADDGVRDMRVIEAVYDSAETGDRIEFDR